MAKTIEISLDIFKDMIETINRAGCQFWACDGYKKEPEAMKTCYRCDTIFHLLKKYPDAKKYLN